MTQEEKAKAYDEALERAKSFQQKYDGDYAGYIFPELRESEDERMMRVIGLALTDVPEERFTSLGTTLKDCLAYLEKQKEQKPERINIKEMVAKYRATDEYVEGDYKGKPVNCMIRAYEQGIRDTLLKVKEQKPAEWSEKDEKVYEYLKNSFEYATNNPQLLASHLWGGNDATIQDYKNFVHKLKSLRPQSKQEWNEEDENLLNKVESMMDSYRDFWKRKEATNPEVREAISRLKSVHPKPEQEWSGKDEKDVAQIIQILDDCYAFGKHNLSKKDHENLVNKLKSLRPQPHEEIYQSAKHDLAIRFMNYLDENRPEGKMGLSNGECEDIDKAFKENDWAKILRYAEKYGK